MEVDILEIPGLGIEDQPVERKFILEDFHLSPVSSAGFTKGEPRGIPENELKFADEETLPEKTGSEVFRELSEPRLPALPMENRARLQMQSPNRIFFYWSLDKNPFQTLSRALGEKAASYILVIKLINKSGEREELFPAGPAGSRWFDVESDTAYRAEVGFFAAGRPFISLLLSNQIETPRSSPSPHFDPSPQFAVTAPEFAEVLDVSGYRQDAVEVAMAGDDTEKSDAATHSAFFELAGRPGNETRTNELRFVLFALASGLAVRELRERISANLFAHLETIERVSAARLSAENARTALEENFGFDLYGEPDDEQEEVSYRTFGASLVNFRNLPKRARRDIRSLSSWALRRF
jgi:hypothetical protein